MRFTNQLRGALIVLAGLICTATPATAEWRRAETPGFIVYSDGDAGVLRDNALQLELFESSLRLLHGADPAARAPRKLIVYLVGDRRSLGQVWPGIPENIAGFYRPSEDGVFAVAVRERGSLDTLLHEYAHHFMMGSSGSGYPGWFIEGYAEYFMTANLSPRRVAIGDFNKGRADWLQYGKWLPTADIVNNRPSQYSDGNAVAMYYAQAWLLTHWFMSEPTRMRQMFNYFGRLRTGEASTVALEAATGMTIADIDRALKAYVRGRVPMKSFSAEQFATPQVAVTTLSRGEDALLLLSLRLSNVSDDKDRRAATLTEVRSRTASFPDDAFARRLLARAEIRMGDREVGETIVRDLVEADPEDTESLLLLAESRILTAREDENADRAVVMGEARRYLGRAYALDDTDFRTLYMLSMTRNGAPGFPNDNDMETLLAAVEFAPQIPGIRLSAAQAYAARDEYGQAIKMLEPMAANPHGDRGSAIARTLIGHYRTSQAGDATASAESPSDAASE
jgi:tetratricopeptide (TPR) repeat protein